MNAGTVKGVSENKETGREGGRERDIEKQHDREGKKKKEGNSRRVWKESKGERGERDRKKQHEREGKKKERRRGVGGRESRGKTERERERTL